jgi:DNA polymerase
MNKLQLGEELAHEIRGCTKCRLSETRLNAVPGEGSTTARIMFVGEGPGENEDKLGRPFVGQAGNVLNRLLETAGLAREDVFIANVVKCRPPANRVPLADEVEACSDYLMAQIAIIEPKFVVPLGVSSLHRLLGKELTIAAARCRVFRKSGILYIPLYHPAASLHNPRLVQQLQADILLLKELINRPLREDEITDLPGAFTVRGQVRAAMASAKPSAVPTMPLTERAAPPSVVRRDPAKDLAGPAPAAENAPPAGRVPKKPAKPAQAARSTAEPSGDVTLSGTLSLF